MQLRKFLSNWSFQLAFLFAVLSGVSVFLDETFWSNPYSVLFWGTSFICLLLLIHSRNRLFNSTPYLSTLIFILFGMGLALDYAFQYVVILNQLFSLDQSINWIVEYSALMVGGGVALYLLLGKGSFPRWQTILLVVCLIGSGWLSVSKGFSILLLAGTLAWGLSLSFEFKRYLPTLRRELKIPANILNLVMMTLICISIGLTIFLAVSETGMLPVQFSLSLILLLGVIRRKVDTEAQLQKVQYWIQIGISLLIIGVIVFLPLLASQWLDRLIAGLKSQAVFDWEWLILVPVVGFAVYLWSNHSLDWRWKSLTVGVTGGIIFTYFSYPYLYALTYNLFVPGIQIAMTQLAHVLEPSLACGIGLILLLGPISTAWSQPRNRSQALAITGLTGLTFSIQIFFAAALAGIIAGQTSIYGLAYSRANYDEIGLAVNVGDAALLITPWVYGCLLVCMILGLPTLLFGLVVPVKRLATSESTFNSKIASTQLVRTFFSLFSLIVCFAIMATLADKIRNTLEATGISHWWKPEWILPTVIFIPTIIFIATVLAAYRNLRKAQPGFAHALQAYAIGGVLLASAAIPYFLLIQYMSTVSLVFSTLTSIAFSLEFYRLGRSLWMIPDETPKQRLKFADFISTIAIDLSLVGVALLPLVEVAIGLALITIPAISEITKYTDPPPGQDWLQKLITSVFSIAPYMSILSWCFTGIVLMSIFSIIEFTIFNEPFWAFRWQRLQPVLLNLKVDFSDWFVRPFPRFKDEKFRLFLYGLLMLGASLLASIPLTTLVTYLFLRRRPRLFANLRWSSFVLSAISFVLGMVLVLSDTLPILANLLVGIPLAVLYRAVIYYNEGARKELMNFLFILGLGSLLTFSLGQSSIIVSNGVARFDGVRWENFGPQNSPLVGDRNYRILRDSTGAIWFTGHYGPDARLVNNEWTKLRFATETVSSSEGRESRLATPGIFAEKNGAYWYADETKLYAMVLGEGGYRLKLPNRQASGAIVPTALPLDATPAPAGSVKPANNFREPGVGAQSCPGTNLGFQYPVGNECPAWDANITTILFGNHEDAWVGTDGAGVVHFKQLGNLDDATWEFFNTTTTGILSNHISGGLLDNRNNLWWLSPEGLSQLAPDGSWSTYPSTQIGLQGNPLAIFEDAQKQLWLGSSTGTAVWNGAAWKPIDFPSPAAVSGFYQVRSGDLWAMTSKGAYRHEHGAWSFVVDIPVDPFWQNPFGVSSFYTLAPYETGVRTMIEMPNGLLWFGGPRGALRYDPEFKKTEYFYPSNSGIPSEDVKSMLIDSAGRLWVSTYTINRAQGSRLPVYGFAFIFLVIVLGNIYAGYQRSPNYLATQVFHRISERPELLLAELYRVCRLQDGRQILDGMNGLWRHEDPRTPLILAYYAVLNTEDQTAAVTKAGQIHAALASQPSLPNARELTGLYEYLLRALQVQKVSEISELPLRFARTPTGATRSMVSDVVAVFDLPDLVSTQLADILDMFGKSAATLKRYGQVETNQDRLSYLADSLSSLELARRLSSAAARPEQVLLLAICERWLQLVGKELDQLSGHADLQIEFRTRQIKYAEQVTLVLRVKNIGNALADDVRVRIQSNPEMGLQTTAEVTLDHLSAGDARNVELTLQVAVRGNLRIAGEVLWSDRIARNNQIDFADVIRLYETSETFEPIPNPYIVGHPVRSASLFLGREDIFEFIRQTLSGTNQSHTLVLYGQRRTGKTSVLYQIANGRLGAGFIPVLIDVQELAPALNQMSDLFIELAQSIRKALKRTGRPLPELDEQAFGSAPTRAFSRFLDTVEELLEEVKLLLMFDEFELIEERLKQGKLPPEALGYLRSLIQHKDYLVFIFTGTHKLEQMSADYWSIFFNIALHFRLSYMLPEDAARLVREPVQGKLSMDDLVVEKILTLTHGHPYFVQLICWGLVNYCNKQERNYVTLNELNAVVTELITTGEAYFAFIWQLANVNERLILAALAYCSGPGRTVIALQEVLEALTQFGINRLERDRIVSLLDGLVSQEILTSTGLDSLQYSYQVSLIEEWVRYAKPLRALAERDA